MLRLATLRLVQGLALTSGRIVSIGSINLQQVLLSPTSFFRHVSQTPSKRRDFEDVTRPNLV